MVLNANEYKSQDKDLKAAKFYDVGLPRDELQRNLGGGIPKNSLILIEGIDGAGKSIISQRFTYGLLSNGATVSYISSELNTISFVEQMNSIDYDIKNYLLEQKLLFIPMFPFIGKTTHSPDFLERLLNSREIFAKEVIVFDALSFFHVKNNIDEQEVYDILGKLKQLTTLGKTIVFCVDPEHISKLFITLIRNICDLYFKLDLRSVAGSRINVLDIQRFKRPMGPVTTVIPFRIEPGKGLAIDITTLD